MLLIKLWNYLRGYVIIKLSGEYAERLLNQAALKRIYLWDIRRVNGQTLTAKTGVKDFFRLCRLSRKTRCRIQILQRAGLFFLFQKLRRRKMLVAGAILFIFALYFLSSLIWSIDVMAVDRDLKASVERDLRLWGLREGSFKYGIDKQLYTDKILTKYTDVAWAQMYFRGSRLVVELVEKHLQPELEDNTPCDIIASKDGIIEEIIPFSGEALVKPGDTVSQGDMLISGKIATNRGKDDKGNPIQEIALVPAQGIVKARVWYQRVVKVPLIRTETTPTGAVKKWLTLHWGGKELRLPWGDVRFLLYETEVIRRIDFPGSGYGGLRLDISLIREMEQSKRFLGVDEASAEAETHLLSELKAFDAANVTQKRTEYLVDSEEKAVIGSLTVEIIEDIGQRAQLP